jgi:transcriptional regulator with XRE-family HTH domain
MAREFAGLKQDDVAKHLSIARTTLTNIETGRRKVDALELARLAKLYQRPESWFTGEDAAAESAFPAEVVHVAWAAASLSAQDRQQLAHFADFLKSRARSNRVSRDG